jgi:cellulose synthase/poly-beta-1,6-N-acetylglucosamine synthase-like glycosyltransferase
MTNSGGSASAINVLDQRSRVDWRRVHIARYTGDLASSRRSSPWTHSPTIGGVQPDQISVLLCTYNGERFLQQQLESISAQSHHKWRLIISDDASCDATLSILRNYKAQRTDGQVEIRVQAKRQGAVANFMSLLTDGVTVSRVATRMMCGGQPNLSALYSD